MYQIKLCTYRPLLLEPCEHVKSAVPSSSDIINELNVLEIRVSDFGAATPVHIERLGGLVEKSHKVLDLNRKGSEQGVRKGLECNLPARKEKET